MKKSTAERDRISSYLRLHLTDQVGPITFARLLDRFGSIDRIFKASPAELASVPRISHDKAHRMIGSWRQAEAESTAEAEIQLAQKLGIKIITADCEDYPVLLSKVPKRPAVLYVKGSITRADELAVAVVGSRYCSQYGMEQASRISHLLAAAGFTIISGLARGIDTAAHRGALAAGGRTIAVQGRGLAGIYPKENAELAQQIIENGALVSELPLKYEPIANTFPARNRIISGLSLGTIVVEARQRSGALITARLALEQNREVMAVPGRIDAPGSKGPHMLIKQGAQLVESIDDILEALGSLGKVLQKHTKAAELLAQQKTEQATLFDISQLKLNDNEQAVLNCTGKEPVHINQIIEQGNLQPGQAYAAATSLQLKGIIKQLPGSYYQLKINYKT